jgi:cation transport regulator ChaC
LELNTSLDTDKEAQIQAHRVEKELNEQIEPISKEIQYIQSIKSYLNTASIENTDINEVKENIKNFSPELYTSL